MTNGLEKVYLPFNHSNQKHLVLHVLLFQFGEEQASGNTNMVS